MSDQNGYHIDDGEEYSSRIVGDTLGNRRYTLNTIVDQIIGQFVEETQGRQDILGEYDTLEKQRDIITELTDYVLAREYISLVQPERQWLIRKVYQDLFRFGPLEKLIADESITEISINRYDEIYFRRGFGDLERSSIEFEHRTDLEQLLQRVLAPIGINLEDDPFIEAGIVIAGRRIRLSLVGPPMMPNMSGQIRLHPKNELSWEELTSVVPPLAQELIQTIVGRGYGLMIAGDVGVAKTSLMRALLAHIPEEKLIGMVERAREIALSPAMNTIIVSPSDLEAARPFDKRLSSILENKIDTLFIDEIRGDEGAAFWQVLTNDDHPQLVAVFRGKANPSRLHSAFSMGIRKAHHQLSQSDIDSALLARFPFVLGLTSQQHTAPIMEFLGQWQEEETGFQLEPLIKFDEGEWHRTSIVPVHDLS